MEIRRGFLFGFGRGPIRVCAHRVKIVAKRFVIKNIFRAFAEKTVEIRRRRATLSFRRAGFKHRNFTALFFHRAAGKPGNHRRKELCRFGFGIITTLLVHHVRAVRVRRGTPGILRLVNRRNVGHAVALPQKVVGAGVAVVRESVIIFFR